jgi:hypothetical protein
MGRRLLDAPLVWEAMIASVNCQCERWNTCEETGGNGAVEGEQVEAEWLQDEPETYMVYINSGVSSWGVRSASQLRQEPDYKTLGVSGSRSTPMCMRSRMHVPTDWLSSRHRD